MSLVERTADAALVEAHVRAGRGALLARLLALRGVTPETAGDYFEPSLSRLAAPTELPGVAEAAAAILSEIRCGGEIVVFGDYDCDGICATAILVETLGILGAKVSPFLPDRLTEGYGMNDRAVARMLAEHPRVSLVVTVDNGVNSVEPVRMLKDRGLRVVVTDHHLPGETLPDCPLVDPKVAAPPALEHLCGSGVAFLLANALVNRAKAEGLYAGPSVGGPLLILAGLATVTDLMPLVGQNRILVSEALKRFRKLAPVGLRELFERVSRTAVGALTSRDFAFMIGPRINAAGRVGRVNDALELLLTADRERCRELARVVDLHNVARKSEEQKMYDLAAAQVVEGASAQVLSVAGHPGVAGIVAARIMERVAVPVCVLVDGHGSARAPDGYHVRDAMVASSEALARFGGHAAAGGLTVREGMLERFRELFGAACAAQAAARGDVPPRSAQVDAFLGGSELTLPFVESLRALEPFGEGNPEPVFGFRGVYLADVKPLGADGRHLHVAFRPASGRLRADALPQAVWWGHGDRIEELRAVASVPHDVAFTAGISDYGERHVELSLRAIV